jgi:hypothetical protein
MNKDNYQFLEYDNGALVYKGVKLHITAENIQDYKFQTGLDPIEWIENTYQNSLSVIRDNKINKILDEK